MKICAICRQSDMLCGACTKRVEEGLIKKSDVALSRAIYKIGKESGYDIDFVESVEAGGRLFVIVESQYAGRFIGPGGRTIKKISEMVGKQIKLLEKAEGSDRHVIERMIGAPIMGINKVVSTGGEAMKVRVEGRYRKMVEPVSGVVGRVLNKKISFVYE
jgi:transcription antitermination factor NusA-like protein